MGFLQGKKALITGLASERSIAHGIAFGFIPYAAAKVLSGRFSEASPAVYILAIGFGLLYGFGLIG